jgi:hypothetical protein
VNAEIQIGKSHHMLKPTPKFQWKITMLIENISRNIHSLAESLNHPFHLKNVTLTPNDKYNLFSVPQQRMKDEER